MADASPSSPKILYPGWQHEFRAALLDLTPRSYESELQPQKPQSSIVFRPFRKAQITLRNGRPLKMLSQASAFSSGTILDFLTGKRSKNHAAM